MSSEAKKAPDYYLQAQTHPSSRYVETAPPQAAALLLCCFAAFVRQTRFELPARQAASTLSLCTLRALLSTPSALCSLTLALSPSGVGDCAADGRDLSSMALIAYHPVLAQPPGSQF